MIVINVRDVSDEQTQMEVISRLSAAYDVYDVEGMLSLHTDDGVWTWIDPGKNIPEFGPEGKLKATGKQEIRKFLEMDRGHMVSPATSSGLKCKGKRLPPLNSRTMSARVPLVCR